MRLGWNRSQDGVITVYAHVSNGKVVDVADFWLSPMAEIFGSRASALVRQQEFAEFLVAAWNASGQASILADTDDDECPYYYLPDEDDVPPTARRFVEIPRASKGCWLNIAGCNGNCGSYGCGA